MGGWAGCVAHTPFKVYVGQGGRLMQVGVQVPAGASPNTAIHAPTRAPHDQDTATGLISQSIPIGVLLQALAGQLVTALSIQAVVGLTAKSHHAITTPICVEQARCLFIIQPTRLATLPCWVPGGGPGMS